MKRQIIKEKKAQLRAWHEQKTKDRESRKSGFYIFSPKVAMDPLLDKAKKIDALRFYQLKIGDGAIGTFLKRIGATKTAEFW